jgi:diguanylate cyclase (GGDEF)-like protein
LALLRTERVAEGEEITGSPDAPRLVSALHRHLLNYARMSQQALVGSTRADDPGGSHRVLSLPIRRRGQRVVGFLAFFAPPGAPAFGVRALRVGEWVARRVCELLDQRYDANTGLPLRVEFERQAELVCSAVGVHQLLFLDVDHLQTINEAFGLHVGDEVLLRVAEVVRRRTPRSGVCARLDGDRMVICLPLTSSAAAETAAQELCAAVAALSYVRGEGKVNIGVSIGIATLVMHEGSSAGWHEGLARTLAFAEAACRQAKAAGCGRHHRWLETAAPVALHVVAAIDAPILERLRRVIASESPTFLAQSLLPLQGYGDPRFELLLRLPMGEGELLAPDKFLPLASRAGLLPAVDRWVIRNVITLLAGQPEVLHRRVARFSVNLSAATLSTPTAAAALLQDMEELLVSTGLPPDVLVFDIPVSELAPGSSAWTAALPSLQRLRMLGCGVALDNCTAADAQALGTQALPLTELKLDGNRVRAMLDDALMDSDMRAALQWAASRGLDTVAKCVETEALRLRVQELGCVYGQGFEMGRPLPLAHVLEDLSMYEMLATAPGAALDA